MNDPVIYRPELQSRLQVIGSTSITLGFWFLYAYLWLPLLSFLAWVLEIEFIYQHMVVYEGYRSLLAVVNVYALIIAGISVVISAWATSNYLRFRDLNRRKPKVPVDDRAVAEFFKVAAKDLAYWKSLKSLVVYHDKQGRVVYGEPTNAEAATPPVPHRAAI